MYWQLAGDLAILITSLALGSFEIFLLYIATSTMQRVWASIALLIWQCNAAQAMHRLRRLKWLGNSPLRSFKY